MAPQICDSVSLTIYIVLGIKPRAHTPLEIYGVTHKSM